MGKSSGTKSTKTTGKKKKASSESLLASGGGNATAAGVTFQGGVGALFAAIGMAQRPLDERLGLGKERLTKFRFETEAPVDDVLMTTDAPGNLFVQAKNTLSLSTSTTSELGKTAEQIVRQWRVCEEGDGTKEWNRPIEKIRDRFVIAVGSNTSDTVAVDLASALSRKRALAPEDVTPKSQTEALTKFSDLLKAAWRKVYESEPSNSDIAKILDVVVVLRFDFEHADLGFGVEVLSSGLAEPASAGAGFRTLASICESAMKDRTGFDIPQIRRSLEQRGVDLLAPPDYRKDHEHFRAFSEHLQEGLKQTGEIRLDQTISIPVPRPVIEAAIKAAEEGSLLIVGEPGAGKTGVLSGLAQRLRDAGNQVLVLAVERTAISTSDGLRSEIGLTHPVRDVLSEWPGTGPAYLLIDGLDAARGGSTELVYRNLIADTLGLADGRWKVVATARSFDLKLGYQFKALFPGTPPDPIRREAGSDFNNVRHIQVRQWDQEELALLLNNAPKLRDAIKAGGDRLRELALTPFNTQLLADVVATGADDSELGSIRNQTELLKLYWNRRVQAFGSPATACLKSTVETMVHERSLRVRQDSVRQLHASALDQMLGSGVLVAQYNDRYVAFRHNILFDYAASRLYLDPDQSGSLHDLFLREQGLGLLLSPALGYSLQELWDSDESRASFWDAIVLLASDKTVDPIARSVIARTSCELPQTEADIQELLARLTDTPASLEVLQAIAGALTIQLHDSPQSVHAGPWAAILAQLSVHARFDNVVIFLLDRLLKLPIDAVSFEQLGVAARQLLARAYEALDPLTTQKLASFSIGYVAKTFASDPKASRALLERIFEPQRLALLAYSEVPALAREIDKIGAVDPDFAGNIYGAVFTHEVTSEKRTTISASQITPITSDEAQDYEMARFSLSQYFPDYLASNPEAGIRALIKALEGRMTEERQSFADQTEEMLNVDGGTIRFVEDGSRIWAWEVESAHPDNMQRMLQSFAEYLRQADAQDLQSVISTLIDNNRLAILWARLLMVAATRPEDVVERLWSFSIHNSVLYCLDTQKDAIDAIVAFYPLRTEQEQSALETAVLTHNFGKYRGVDSVRTDFLSTLFHRIGRELLATDAARNFLDNETAPEIPTNDRLYDLTPTVSEFTPRHWLAEQGVDLATPVHSKLLELSETVKANLGLGQNRAIEKENITAAFAQMKPLYDAIERGQENHADDQLIRTSQGVLSDVCTAIQRTLAGDPNAITDQNMSILKEAVFALSHATYPIGGQDEEARFGRDLIMGGPSPRADAVPQLFYLCRQATTSPEAQERLGVLLSDPHPAVRFYLAKNIISLWNHDRAMMWRFAEDVVVKETNAAVMAQFVHSFLSGLRNLEPERVESIVLQIQDRFPPALLSKAVRGEQNLSEALSSTTSMLYVWNGRERSRERLFEWIANPGVYEDQIRMALFSVRQAMCGGYDSDTPEFQVARERSQSLVNTVVELTTDRLVSYASLDQEQQKTSLSGVKNYAKCLDYACGCLFYASGAFPERNMPNTAPITSEIGRVRFLTDLRPALERIGTIASPHTMWQLVQLLEFLLSAKPDLCFDIFARALTKGGHQQGFKAETLGVDILVRIVGRCLADYAYIFQKPARRQLLIDCLDIFIEAGWPAAQRLLYRLPDALR